MNTLREVAYKIKELRIHRKLTQKYMAEKLGFESVKGYQYIENAVTDLGLKKHLVPLCTILNIEIHELLNINKTIEDFIHEEYVKRKSPPPTKLTSIRKNL